MSTDEESVPVKQTKVLVFCPWAHSNSYYTAKFCNALAQRGVRLLLVAPENFMVHLLSQNVEQVRWPYVAPTRMDLVSFLQSPFQAIRLLRIIDRMRPDWIHLLWAHQVPILVIPWLKRFPFF